MMQNWRKKASARCWQKVGRTWRARCLKKIWLIRCTCFLRRQSLEKSGLAALAGLPLDTVRASAKFRHMAENEKLGTDWLATYARVR
jgi:hypothetical protein